MFKIRQKTCLINQKKGTSFLVKFIGNLVENVCNERVNDFAKNCLCFFLI